VSREPVTRGSGAIENRRNGWHSIIQAIAQIPEADRTGFRVAD
jgi:hypothetical protein